MFKHSHDGSPAKNNQLVVLSASARYAVDFKKNILIFVYHNLFFYLNLQQTPNLFEFKIKPDIGRCQSCLHKK